jgi:transketolase
MPGPNHQPLSSDDLKEMARQIRRDIIKMLMISQSGHSGGPLGLAEVFACLYFHILRYDPLNPTWPGRDFFFLSAGHLAPVWYSALARAGFFPLAELATLRQLNTRLQGHPAPWYTHGLPGVEIASGSLGQGLSIAVGAALGLRMDGKPNHVFVLHGDGELDEGQVWEGMMTAGHYGLDNLTAIVDRNFCQIDNRTNKVMEIEPLADKWRAFRWNVLECDGHDVENILAAVEEARNSPGRPSVILARTFMGRGVSFMEDDYRWHGVPPSLEQGKQALNELRPTKFSDFVEFEWEHPTTVDAERSASR